MWEDVLKSAKAQQKELVRYRRYLHKHAETGFSLDKTLAFVEKTLREIGCTPKKCGKAGLVTTIGKESGKTFLLRADMDALPLREETGLPFACKLGNMHACGHDFHATMLLGAAKLLKEREKELNGCVKLLFQPAEEILKGGIDALKSGILRTPKVHAAMSVHVATATELPTGKVIVAAGGVSAPAADFFTIRIQGKGCHGSVPQKGVDALTAAAHTLVALQEISAREIPAGEPLALTIGSLRAGEAGNVIADFAELKGTLRAFDERLRAQVKTRLVEIAKGVAKAFRATAKVEFTSGCPTLVNDGELSELTLRSLQDALGTENALSTAAFGGAKNMSGGSEDFAYISQKVPSVMVAIGAALMSFAKHLDIIMRTVKRNGILLLSGMPKPVRKVFKCYPSTTGIHSAVITLT